MTKTIMIAIFLFITACSGNKVISDKQVDGHGNTEVQKLIEKGFSEITSKWTITDSSLKSPNFKISQYKNICGVYALYLSTDENADVDTFEKQLLFGNAKRKYALNLENKNCSSIEDDKFFNIASLNGSDNPDYSLFKIAKYFMVENWADSEDVEVVYHDEISEACSVSELTLLEVNSSVVDEDEPGLFDSYEIKSKCRVNDKKWYTYAYIDDYFDNTKPGKKIQLMSVDASIIDDRKLIDEYLHDQEFKQEN